MNLNEAKRILKTAGYELLKEYWDEEPDYDYDPPDGPDPTEYKALIVIDKNNDEVKKELKNDYALSFVNNKYILTNKLTENYFP